MEEMFHVVFSKQVIKLTAKDVTKNNKNSYIKAVTCK